MSKFNFLKCFFIVLISNYYLFAADIKLPAPDKSNQTTLIKTLENRKSCHDFLNKSIDNKTLSTILWVAYGVNRPDGKRTIPTAKNGKDLDIYVFNENGIYLYDAEKNLLLQKSKNNYLNLFNKQPYMKDVSNVLVYVGSKNDYAVMHAGSSYQNVELFITANNMGSIVRGFFDRKEVSEVLNLPKGKKGKRVIISQAIGYKNN